LIAAGAFDSLNDNRRQLTKGIDMLLAHAQEAGERANSMMSDLFADQPQPLPPLPVIEDWPPLERLGYEFEAIGFYLTAHPLNSSADALRMMRVVPLQGLAASAQAGTSSRRRMAAIVVTRQFRRTKQGNPFAIVTGSDPTGLFDFWVFAETLATCREILEPGRSLLMDVDVGQQNDQLRITAVKVEDLETALAAVGNEVVLDLKSSVVVATVRSVVGRLETGRHRIKLTVPLDDGNRLSLAVPGSFNLGGKERQALKSLAGITAIHQNVVR
jgi:DNA polymerase-3 subunit alpha